MGSLLSPPLSLPLLPLLALGSDGPCSQPGVSLPSLRAECRGRRRDEAEEVGQGRAGRCRRPHRGVGGAGGPRSPLSDSDVRPASRQANAMLGDVGPALEVRLRCSAREEDEREGQGEAGEDRSGERHLRDVHEGET
eukprot:762639-Hanusia_phi.AAC.5